VCQYQTKNWNLMNFIFFKLLIGYKGWTSLNVLGRKLMLRGIRECK
jgi:hypothetical protein